MLKSEVKVSIAGVTFGIRANKDYPLKWLKQRYISYFSDKPAEVKIHLYYRRDNPGLRQNRLLWRPYSIISEDSIFKVYTKKDYIGIGDLLRSLTLFILTERGGFLIHSCGVIINGGAYLFAGPSGSGKTTLARLIYNGYTLLSDETTAVIKEGSNYYACATPFFGDLGSITSNVKAPLKGILFLKKSGRFHHQQINSVYAASRLIQNIFILGSRWQDKYNMEKLMDIGVSIAKKIPVYELEFLPDKRIWKYIEKKISLGAR